MWGLIGFLGGTAAVLLLLVRRQNMCPRCGRQLGSAVPDETGTRWKPCSNPTCGGRTQDSPSGW